MDNTKTFREFILLEVLGGQGKFSIFRLLRIFFLGMGSARSVLVYRVGKALYDIGYKRIASFFFIILERNYSTFIHPRASIGMGVKFPHPAGIVIGAGAIIGENVTIFQQVTIGGARMGDAQNEAYPIVNDGTVIFSGAKLLGKIQVGSNSIIGANTVVVRDVPDDCIAIGVPSKFKPKHAVDIK